MDIKRIHHVAYRCNDAKETVDFYQRVLGMDLQLAIAENEVPSTKAPKASSISCRAILSGPCER